MKWNNSSNQQHYIHMYSSHICNTLPLHFPCTQLLMTLLPPPPPPPPGKLMSFKITCFHLLSILLCFFVWLTSVLNSSSSNLLRESSRNEVHTIAIATQSSSTSYNTLSAPSLNSEQNLMQKFLNKCQIDYCHHYLFQGPWLS